MVTRSTSATSTPAIVTVIDGASLKAVATFPVGKRPRGIHASPDGKTVYVALSGTPIEGPPELDAQGNPVFKRDKDDDDDDDVAADKSADGIGVIDVATRKLVKKISVGSDPEEFDLSAGRPAAVCLERGREDRELRRHRQRQGRAHRPAEPGA